MSLAGSFYTDSQRRLQERFESRPLADRVEQAIVEDHVGEANAAFIESRDFFFLSTVDADGWPTVSHKGGAPGTVTVRDPSTLLFPSYDGNGMYLSMGNIEATGRIGLLFIDFETPHRLRVQATASLHDDEDLLARYPGADLVVVARVERVFVNCARYVHRHDRAAASPYVPDDEGRAPYPSWKRIDLLQDALHPDDQARTGAEGGVITIEDYGAKLAAGES